MARNNPVYSNVHVGCSSAGNSRPIFGKNMLESGVIATDETHVFIGNNQDETFSPPMF